MEHRTGLHLLCFILVALGTTITADSKCRNKCTGSPGSYVNLEEGTTYVYNFEGNTETAVPKSTGPHGDSSRLNVKAQVEVSVQPQCATLIKLKDVQVTGPDSKKFTNLNKLEEHPLRVSLNGGKLDDEICVVPGDDYTSVNIKRAVASFLHVNAPQGGGSAHEIDVFGECPTDYRVNKDGEVTIIQKHRNLNKCAYREDLRQELFAIAHSGSSEFQTSPILDSHLVVEQKIKGGIVDSVVAKESYVFRPFANRDNGLRSRITTKLTFVSKSKAAAPAGNFNEPRSILFENPHEVVSANIQTVSAALHKVVDNMVDSVSTTSPVDFTNFVHVVRRASKPDLLSIYGQVKAGAGFKNKELAKKVFTDALFRSGSADSVAVAIELLKSREITDKTARLWYLSFAFARHASSASLSAASSLLDEADLPREAYLGVGALAGKYCREHQCEGVPEFDQLLGKLAKLLANPVPANREDENKLIGSLKALRNIHRLNDEVAGKVAAVIRETKAPTRLRAAALDTAHSDPCRGKLQKAITDTLSNKEEDAELRIKSYLVVVACPTAKSATKISQLLENEPINQVGSFITSHLRQLRASANPDKQLAREVFANVRSRKSYPIDIRKYSQNYEMSYNIDALNTAAGVESNVIFSQDSYLPRSVSLNLTAEVFGKAFNFLELNGRAENLDRILERYFGPKGYLKSHTLNEVYEEANDNYKNVVEKVRQSAKKVNERSKRSVTRQQTDAVASKVKLHKSALDENLDVDLSLRVLGNELAWLNINDNTNRVTPDSVIDQVAAYVEQGIGSTKNFDYNFKNHLLFLDTELTYPTGTGFPLRLTATGSSIVHLKLAGNVDVARIMENPKNAEFKVTLIPSAAVEVVGLFTIDGYAVESGVKAAATLHTSTGTDVTVKLLEGSGFDAHVGLPVKKQDLITVSSVVTTIVKERGQPQVDYPLNFEVQRRDYHGCFDQLAVFTGLTLCTDVGFPSDQQPLISNAALYPLNGNAKLSLSLEKEDDTLQSYHFKFYLNKNNPKHRSLEFTVDTPGSSTNRKISLLAEYKTEPNHEVNVNLIAPHTNVLLQGLLIDSDKEHSLSAKFKFNENVEYSAKVGLTVNGATYTPVVDYKATSGPELNVKVDGTVTVEKKPGTPYRKYTFNNVRLTTPKGVYSISGTIAKDTDFFSTDAKLGYDDQSVAIKAKYQKAAPHNFKISGEVLPSQFPDFGVGFSWDYQKTPELLQNNLVIVHGSDLTSKINRISLSEHATYKVGGDTFEIATKQSASYPLLKIDAKLDGTVTKKTFSYDLQVTYEEHKIASKLDAKTSIAKPRDYKIIFSASAFKREIQFEASRDIKSPHSSKFSNKLQLSPGGAYELVSDVDYSVEKNNINCRANTLIRVSDVPDEYRFDIGYLDNPTEQKLHTKAQIGNNVYLDAHRRGTKTPITEEIKFNLRNVVEASGTYKYDNGKGHGEAVIDLVRLGRKIKGTADVTLTPKSCNAVADILLDADKDPSKKIHIDTQNEYDLPSLIRSKNKINACGNVVLIDVTNTVEGTPNNGKSSTAVDFTLPNGQNFVGNFHRTVKFAAGNGDGRVQFDVAHSEKKGSPQSKVSGDFEVKNFDSRRLTGGYKALVTYSCPKGDAKYSAALNIAQTDGVYTITDEIELSGSHIPKPVKISGKAVAGKGEFDVHSAGSYGDDYSFDITSKGTSIKKNQFLTQLLPLKAFEFNGKVKTPLETVKNLEFHRKVTYEPAEGNGAYKYTLNDEFVINDSTYKYSVDAAVAKHNGLVKVAGECPHYSPVSGSVKYSYDPSGDLKRAEVVADLKQGNQPLIAISYQGEYKKDLSILNGHLTGQTSLERMKKFEVQVAHKSQSQYARTTDLKVVVNDQKVDLTSKIDLTPEHPIIDVAAITAAGKSRVYVKVDRKGEREGTAEGQIQWAEQGGGQLDFSANVDLQSVDNFLVTIRVNSEKLKINKLKLEVGNRQAKSGTGRKINFVAQTADKKGFTGSATYALKETDVGYSIEGKGNINIKNENHPLNYKFVSRKLIKAVDNEAGGEVVLTVDYAKNKVEIKHKLTDKQGQALVKYCKEAECSQYNLQSKLVTIDVNEFHQEVTLLVDNKLFERKDYIEMKSVSKRKGFVIDNENSLKIQDVKYELKNYVHNGEAGIVCILPQREIALIATFELPSVSSKQQKSPSISHSKLEVNVYLDRKKNPTDKTTVLLVSDINRSGSGISIDSEAKFAHPSLQKDLSVKGKAAFGLDKKLVDATIDIDVFSKKNQKIVLNVKLNHDKIGDSGHNVTGAVVFVSKGLVIDIGGEGHTFFSKDSFSFGSFLHYDDDKNVRKETGFLVEANTKRFFALLKSPNKEILKLDSKLKLSKQQQVLDGELSVAGANTLVGNLEINGYNSAKACLHAKEDPSKKLQATVALTPQQFEARAVKNEGGKEDELFSVNVKLDEKEFLKFDYELKTENIKAVVEHLRKLLEQHLQQVKILVTELGKEVSTEFQSILEGVKKAQPNIKPLLQAYETQLNAIKEELYNDKLVKEVSGIIKNLIGGVAEAIAEFIRGLTVTIEKAVNQYQEIQNKLLQTVKKSLPGLEKAYEKVVHSFVELLQNLVHYATISMGKALDFVQNYQGDIKGLLSGVSEIFRDVGRLAAKTFVQLRKEVQEFITIMIDQVKALPIYAIVQERIEELKQLEVPEQVFQILREVSSALEDSLPTQELRQLVSSVVNYLEKRLKNESVDDIAEIRNIADLFLKALQSLVDIVKHNVVTEDASSLFGFQFNIPLPSTTFINSIPRLGSIKFSPISWLLSDDRPSLSEYYHTYKPTLDSSDYIPPYRAYGLLVNSHHFFTFDRRHFSFKGSCSYVLAQDFKDGNFSIVANLEGGKLKSITVNDPTDTIELLNDNTALVNGKPSEYPIYQNDFSGWRRYTTVNVKNRAGVWIQRDLLHDIWVFRVSGFYFGRTRGLLGTIDNEHYDDFLLPNGQIAKDAAEFANAYKVVGSCPDVPTVPPASGHVQQCTDLFTSDSPLSSAFNIINPENYRDACDQHAQTAADKLKAACEIAAGYVAALREDNYYAKLPHDCAKCSVNNKQYELGDTESVKVSQAKADFVFVVEQSTHNAAVFKELVTPLIASLSKDIGDVEVAIIGFGGPHKKYPQHFTNNGKLKYEGKSDKLEFVDAQDETVQPPYDTLAKKFKFVKYVVDTELGLQQIVVAMNEANIYPFRVGASKNIVLIHTTPCPKSPLFPFSIQIPRIIAIDAWYRNHGLNYYIVSPLSGLTVQDKPDNKVVGFDKNHVYTLGDAKKKPLTGDSALRKDLHHDLDLCVIFSQTYGGAAFSSNNFNELKPEQRKKYVQVVSQLMSKTVAEQNITEECTCHLYGGLYAHPKCSVSSRA